MWFVILKSNFTLLSDNQTLTHNLTIVNSLNDFQRYAIDIEQSLLFKINSLHFNLIYQIVTFQKHITYNYPNTLIIGNK